jgi:hypothetical protein
MNKLVLTLMSLSLTACLPQTKQDTHTHCAQEGSIPTYENYCCGTYDNGHCSYTCQRQSGTRWGCIKWECDEGYVWQAIPEEEQKWWQFGLAGSCIKENSSPSSH